MTLAIRQRTTVDEHHRVFAQVDELEPGQAVEIIRVVPGTKFNHFNGF